MKHRHSSWSCCMRHRGHGSEASGPRQLEQLHETWAQQLVLLHETLGPRQLELVRETSGPGQQGQQQLELLHETSGPRAQELLLQQKSGPLQLELLQELLRETSGPPQLGQTPRPQLELELLQGAARGLGPSVASDDCTCCRHNSAPPPPPQTEKRALSLSLSLSLPPYLCLPRERNSEQRPGGFICRSGLNWLVMLLEAMRSLSASAISAA